MKTFEPITTKVSATTYKQLMNICKKKGITVYNMLQMMCDCIVRYMSSDHNLTPQMESVMSIFEHLEGWNNCFNLAEHDIDPEVGEAVYFIGNAKRKGMRAVHVSKPFMGTWKQCENIQEIIERFFCLIIPERYRRLRQVATMMQCKSILEVIDHLIDRYVEDTDLNDIRAEFEDADRSDFGTKPTDQRYKRKLHRDIDSKVVQGNQQTILFTDDDAEMAREEANDGTL